MIKMIIVDDELLIRKGLEGLCWESVGVQVVGTAANALEALEMVQRHSPQILFTDIRMPGMNGLQLVEMAQTMVGGIKSVILTGYGEFEYARKAISLSVAEYILKPCSAEQVLEVVRGLVEVIKREDELHRQTDELHVLLREQERDQLEDRLRDILCGVSLSAAAWEELEQLPCGRHVVALARRCSDEEDIRLSDFLQDVRATAEQRLGEAPWAVWMEENLVALVFRFLIGAPATGQEDVRSLLARCSVRHGEYALKISVSDVGSGIRSIRESCTQSAKGLSRLFSIPGQQIICMPDSMPAQPLSLPPTDLVNEILHGFKERNYTRVEAALSALREYCEAQAVEEQRIKYLVIDLCRSCQHILVQIRREELPALSVDTYLDINAIQDLQGLIAYAQDFIWRNIDLLNNKQKDPTHRLARQIDEYMDLHCADNACISDFAAEIHMNADYLGKLIKKRFGRSFYQMLLDRRMEKACGFLADPEISISEIAELVGVCDARYFGKLFRDRYGATPSEYRKKLYAKG